mgnify:CR=1 FL=1
MKTVFEPTVGMTPQDTSYCPGCSHGIAHRIIMECLAERGQLGVHAEQDALQPRILLRAQFVKLR